MEFVGLTGPIRFKEGRRSNITLDLLKLKRENLTKVGEWNVQSGLNITDPVAFYEGSTPNITLIVMTNEVLFIMHNWLVIINPYHNRSASVCQRLYDPPSSSLDDVRIIRHANLNSSLVYLHETI